MSCQPRVKCEKTIPHTTGLTSLVDINNYKITSFVTEYFKFFSKVQRIEEELTSAVAKKKHSEKSALDLEETVRSRDTEISFLKNKLHDVEQSFASSREKQKDLEQECIVVKSKYSKLEAHYENVHEQKVM